MRLSLAGLSTVAVFSVGLISPTPASADLTSAPKRAVAATGYGLVTLSGDEPSAEDPPSTVQEEQSTVDALLQACLEPSLLTSNTVEVSTADCELLLAELEDNNGENPYAGEPAYPEDDDWEARQQSAPHTLPQNCLNQKFTETGEEIQAGSEVKTVCAWLHLAWDAVIEVPDSTEDDGSMPAGKWGMVKPPVHEKVVDTTNLEILRSIIQQQPRVPMPDPNSKKAQDTDRDNVRYMIYMIYMNDRPTLNRVWKYGITTTEGYRPNRQLSKCNENQDPTEKCGWRPLRTEVRGFYRARMYEAAYIANYVRKHASHDCPPAQVTSCR